MVGESRQQGVSTSYGPRWGSGTHTSVMGLITTGDVWTAINYPYSPTSAGLDSVDADSANTGTVEADTAAVDSAKGA